MKAIYNSVLCLLSVQFARAWLLVPPRTSSNPWKRATRRLNVKHKRESSLLAVDSTVSAAVSLLSMRVNNTTRLGQYQAVIDAAAASTQNSCTLIGIRTIGVDFGLVRTGIATSVGYQPTPLAILTDLNSTQLCERIVQYARSEQASQIVVGLPLHKNGTLAEQTNITLVFAAELMRYVVASLGANLPVILWDERYTSKEAAARAHADHPGRSLYGTLDAEAACIILEHYYNENGQGALRIELDESTRRDCLKLFEQRLTEGATRLMQVVYEREAKLRRRSEMLTRRRVEEEAAILVGVERSRKKKKKRKR
ncbi:hypothetical protein MPSEU_000373600 [Mayamaea pseudoterrestris]|nr:hypothetical protein MPSEU_000373600 [Mayamaea pseudoterrestris]